MITLVVAVACFWAGYYYASNTEAINAAVAAIVAWGKSLIGR